MIIKSGCLVFVFLTFLTFASHAKKTVTLASTNWCPYTCDFNGNRHGLVGEILQSSLGTLGLDLKIEYYPWSRAIQLANQNKVDGLLTATREEAPNLLFSASPIGTYQMCFYSKATNPWRYQPDLDLGSNKLAVIQDYGYGEPLDKYINTNKSGNIISISGENSTYRLLRLLQLGRADIIIEDSKVLRWVTNTNNLDISHIKEVGCLNEQPFYLALSPNKENLELMQYLNQTLVEAFEKFKIVSAKIQIK